MLIQLDLTILLVIILNDNTEGIHNTALGYGTRQVVTLAVVYALHHNQYNMVEVSKIIQLTHNVTILTLEGENTTADNNVAVGVALEQHN